MPSTFLRWSGDILTIATPTGSTCRTTGLIGAGTVVSHLERWEAVAVEQGWDDMVAEVRAEIRRWKGEDAEDNASATTTPTETP